MARALRPNIKCGKSHHCSFAVHKSRIIKVGLNDYKRIHPAHKFGEYKDHKGYETKYRASLHSEVSLAIKLGEEDWSDFEIVNVRIGNDDKIRQSKPCKNCERCIIDVLNPKRVFYTTDDGNFNQL